MGREREVATDQVMKVNMMGMLAVRENSCLAAIDKGNKYLNQIPIMNTISSFIRLGFLCFNIKLQ